VGLDISPAPVVHKGQCRLQILVGSMVRIEGKPQIIGLLNIVDRKNEAEVLARLIIRRVFSDRKSRPSNNSFKGTPIALL
jgi:hypothetical protein